MSAAVGSAPNLTRSGFPVFCDFSSFVFKSSSRIISAVPLRKNSNCSSIVIFKNIKSILMDNLPQSFDSTKTLTKNLLEKTEIAFIGCGVMAESIVAGILRQHFVKPEQIVASHPRAARREELRAKYGINVFGENVDAAKAVQKSKESIVCLSIKPQRIKTVLDELENNITPEQLTVSIVAGAKIETIESKLKT